MTEATSNLNLEVTVEQEPQAKLTTVQPATSNHPIKLLTKAEQTRLINLINEKAEENFQTVEEVLKFYDKDPEGVQTLIELARSSRQKKAGRNHTTYARVSINKDRLFFEFTQPTRTETGYQYSSLFPNADDPKDFKHVKGNPSECSIHGHKFVGFTGLMLDISYGVQLKAYGSEGSELLCRSVRYEHNDLSYEGNLPIPGRLSDLTFNTYKRVRDSANQPVEPAKYEPRYQIFHPHKNTQANIYGQPSKAYWASKWQESDSSANQEPELVSCQDCIKRGNHIQDVKNPKSAKCKPLAEVYILVTHLQERHPPSLDGLDLAERVYNWYPVEFFGLKPFIVVHRIDSPTRTTIFNDGFEINKEHDLLPMPTGIKELYPTTEIYQDAKRQAESRFNPLKAIYTDADGEKHREPNYCVLPVEIHIGVTGNPALKFGPFTYGGICKTLDQWEHIEELAKFGYTLAAYKEDRLEGEEPVFNHQIPNLPNATADEGLPSSEDLTELLQDITIVDDVTDDTDDTEVTDEEVEEVEEVEETIPSTRPKNRARMLNLDTEN